MEQEPKRRDNFLAVSILIASFVIGGSLIYSVGVRNVGGDFTGNITGGSVPPTDNETTTSNPTVDDDVIQGDLKAPVTFIVFGDYQCPFCGATSGFNAQTIASLRSSNPNWQPPEPNIFKDYVASGKVRVVYRDFPLDQIQPYARPAAEAAECARDQNKYWAYHDKLFQSQAQLSTDVNFYVGIASDRGLNATQFEACVKSRKYKDEVEKDYQDGLKAGVNGTPGNFVIASDGSYGKFISGAQSYDVFKAAIEEALKAAGE